MDPLDILIFDVPLIDWLVVLGIGLGIAIVLILVQTLIAGRAARLSARTSNVVDDLIVNFITNTRRFTLLAFGLLAATWVRQFPEEVKTVIARGFFIVILIQIGLWGSSILNWWIERYRAQKLEEDPAAVTTITAMSFLVKIALWAVLLLAALDNFGVDVTALVTGLGIGGIAVALAVQNILGDLFASLSIVLDKPFVVGDFLSLGDYKGAVEHIGLKTTRLRSLTGEELIISNSDLLKSRIRNYKSLYERRASFSIGIEYETPADLVVAVPGELTEIVSKYEDIRLDRAHFKSFGDFALLFEVVFYVERPEYNFYMDTQQSINLDIMTRFREIGINMAFPTQTVLLQNVE